MTIGALLASITGEQPSPSPTTAPRPSDAIPKRKAVEDLRGVPTKAPRTESLSNRPRSNGSSPRPSPRPVDRPATLSRDKPATTSQTSTQSNLTSKKPLSTSSKDGRETNSSTAARNALSSKPLAKRPANTASTPAPELKKRSFAEIMARAAANTTSRESLGKIQHKPIEKPMTMKERKELKAEEARKLKQTAKQKGTGKYTGTAASSRSGVQQRPGQKPAPSTATKSSKDRTPPVEEKKVKKAALATTGYTGTARPKPGAISAKPGAASRPGREGERERPRYGGALSRPRRYEEDDELDDFIEYDDEEEPRYGYGRPAGDSEEDESDMEADVDDMFDEEEEAERAARREDLKEMELEKRLKKEKEERKRKLAALAAAR